MTKVGLWEIFAFQNACADAHLGESQLLRDSAQLVSEALALSNQILQSMQFGAEKQSAIRVLTVDAISHVAVAMRLGFWGALPEGVAVFRGALESAAQLSLVVKQQNYKTFNYELSRKLNRLSYESAFEELGELGDSLESLHGKISERPHIPQPSDWRYLIMSGKGLNTTGWGSHGKLNIHSTQRTTA